MPAKLTVAEKKERGTYRPGEEQPPRPLHRVRKFIADATERMETAQRIAGRAEAAIERDGKWLNTGRGARYKHKPHPALRKLKDTLQRITSEKRTLVLLREEEVKALAVQAALDAVPEIRPGLDLMSYADCMNSQPPLSHDEELEWLLVGAATTVELARRKLTAGLQLTAEEQKCYDALDPKYR